MIGIVLAIFFVPMFIGMWLLVLRLLPLFGWSKLAKNFSARGEPTTNAKAYRGVSLAFGGIMPATYKNCINAWVDLDGFYLEPSRFFKLFHPKLFLRWNAIHSVEEKQFLVFKQVKVQMIGNFPPLLILGQLGKVILEKWLQINSSSKV